MEHHGVFMRRIVALVLVLLWLPGGQTLGEASEPAFDAPAIRVDISIKASLFGKDGGHATISMRVRTLVWRLSFTSHAAMALPSRGESVAVVLKSPRAPTVLIRAV